MLRVCRGQGPVWVGRLVVGVRSLGGRLTEELVERVLLAVEQVPAGRVVSYGDVAELVGTGPRLVGRVLAEHGDGVPWWRVTNSYGDPPRHLLDAAAQRWTEEAITLKANGRGCRIAQFRADPARLAGDYERATAHLASGSSGRSGR